MESTDEELGRCIRSWRERSDPREAGLPATSSRRVSGLRREEVAHLAGVSVDYLSRLEQGRASHPSPSVVAALARALRCTDAERDHLYRLAGHAPPTPGTIHRHLGPGIQRMLDRLSDVPVIVVDAAWQIQAANDLAGALLGAPLDTQAPENNIAWRHFTAAPSRVIRSPTEHAAVDLEIVADLHDAAGRYPADEPLINLIADLRSASPRFAELWRTRPVRPRVASRKTFEHPEIGRITLDCDVLIAQDSDLRLIVYTAPAGSPDARALALLSAIGLQPFRS